MKRRGALTVEVLLLLVVILSVSGYILSIQLRIARYQEMFSLIEDAGKDTARALYAMGRLKSAVFEEGATCDMVSYQLLDRFIGSQLGNTFNNIGQVALNNMMRFNLQRRAGVSGAEQFNAKFNLAKELDFYFEVDGHALVITTTLPYKAVVPLAPYYNYQPQIRQIIPLREARSVVVGHRDLSGVLVTVTDYGLSTSHVYHTMDCMGQRFAKSRYQYRIAADAVGGNVEIAGNTYKLCYFCSRGQK